tara:strand:+ start:787 stop:1125 length:339 start_codon:yes stop_codon:yes gene_type:complete
MNDMDKLNQTVNDVDNEINNIITNFDSLKNKLYDTENLNQDQVIEKLSHLSDLKEIIWILNEKIVNINDNIEKDTLRISEYALDRIENNKIIKKAIQPFLPYIIGNLYHYNT